VTDASSSDDGDGSTPLGGRWVVHRTQTGYADLEIFWDDRTNWRRWIATRALRASDGGFRVEQDAGTLTFAGELRDGTGSGTMRFVPNRAFVGTLRTLGIGELESVTDHNLKNLAWGEMSATTIRELQAMGYASLTLEDVQAMGIFGVTPAYARAMRAAGVQEAATAQGIVNLQHGGASAEYAGELAAVGLRGLDADQLRELRRNGVTAAFVRETRKDGKPLPVDELLALRRDMAVRTRTPN
jgi:hypothetical protein